MQGGSQAAVLVDAGGGERAAAGAGGDLAAFEVAEEFVPFGVGGGAVFLGRSQCPPSGEEREVGLDGLIGVDGLVAEGDVDVAVAGDDLVDVGGWPSIVAIASRLMPRLKLVESNVPATLNTSAGAGRLEAAPGLVITGMDLRGRVACPGQERPPAGDCDACRHVRGMAARRRAAWPTGELAAARTSVSGARGCIRCNESGWLPGQARDVTNDAEARRVPCSCGAGRAPPAGSGDDAPGATGCSRMHRDASRRNDDAGHAAESAASSLHRIHAGREVPGHCSRAAARKADGTAGPHAAPQAARVHANCRMMHEMQFCSFSPAWPAYA